MALPSWCPIHNSITDRKVWGLERLGAGHNPMGTVFDDHVQE